MCCEEAVIINYNSKLNLGVATVTGLLDGELDAECLVKQDLSEQWKLLSGFALISTNKCRGEGPMDHKRSV